MEQDMGDLREKYSVLVWRLVALVYFFIWVTKGLLRFFVFGPDLSSQPVFPVPAYIVFYIVTVIAALLLILFPRKFHIYAALFLAWGVIQLIEGKTLLGIAEYVLAGAFAWYLGFFKTRIKAKVGILLGVLFAAIVWRVGPRFLTAGTFLLWCLEFVLAAGIGWVFFLSEVNRKERAQKLPGGKMPLAGLSACGLAPDDITILRRILKKEKYESIAADYGISVATFNRRVRTFFKQAGAANHADFCRQYGDDDNPDLPAAELLSVQ